MQEILLEDYIDKIIFLETEIGANITYNMLDPFQINTSDIVSIQNAAKKIAEFIGLNDYRFIIIPCRQEEKVAGHIELKSWGNEVVIEISDDILDHNDTVLATLGHEITHKFLHINSISYGSTDYISKEEEILTDIASIFVGLGKVILNGCESQVSYEKFGVEGKMLITKTINIGYLNRLQYAFIYRLICAMRKIPSKDFKRSLSSSALKSIRECEKNYGKFFMDRFHAPDAKKDVIKDLQSTAFETQKSLSVIDKNLIYLENAYINKIKYFTEKKHRDLNIMLKEAGNIDNKFNPCLRYLNLVKLDQKKSKLKSEYRDYQSEINLCKQYIKKITNFIQKIEGDYFHEPKPSMFTVVTCRNDGTKLKIPEGKNNLRIKCPKCGYSFFADTTSNLYGYDLESNLKSNNKSFSKIKSILKKLLKLS